MQQKEKRPTKM